MHVIVRGFWPEKLLGLAASTVLVHSGGRSRAV